MRAIERLMAKVIRRNDGCWEWVGFVTPDGYGAVGYKGRRGVLAHRAIYTEIVGEIPSGLDLDHVCHTNDKSCPGGNSCHHRRCVNPNHLEPVTPEENARRSGGRRTHCPYGHEYAEGNIYIYSNGKKACVICAKKRSVAQKAALKKLGGAA